MGLMLILDIQTLEVSVQLSIVFAIELADISHNQLSWQTVKVEGLGLRLERVSPITGALSLPSN